MGVGVCFRGLLTFVLVVLALWGTFPVSLGCVLQRLLHCNNGEFPPSQSSRSDLTLFGVVSLNRRGPQSVVTQEDASSENEYSFRKKRKKKQKMMKTKRIGLTRMCDAMEG